MIKRLADIVLSLVLLAALLPLMLGIAAAIRLTSRGPAVFRQRRAGRHGRAFTMLKFRTMRSDVDAYGSSPQSPDDERLTSVGRWLRQTSLDELPQLLNVLAGQMSLVGPRPLYERQATLWNERQRRRLEVRPGITGYAQVHGRSANTLEDKLELDVYYVEHRSLRLDAAILFRTLRGLLGAKHDVYERRYSRDRQREDD